MVIFFETFSSDLDFFDEVIEVDSDMLHWEVETLTKDGVSSAFHPCQDDGIQD